MKRPKQRLATVVKRRLFLLNCCDMTTYAFADILTRAENAAAQFRYDDALTFYNQLLTATDPNSADPVEQGSRYKAYAEQGRIL
ncbi:MAG: hypothetical protein KDE28_13150, partial [Anaerolineales bacterium]|nr:hypothetical protein [Anaerolineales bacterium]